MLMFNLKIIEQNIPKYSGDQLSRKLEIVGMKTKDLNQQIQVLFKQISDLSHKNISLEYNLHSTTRDRVQDLDKITFDGQFYKEYKNRGMEKEVQNYINTYNHLLGENEIIENNYKLIENNNVKSRQTINSFSKSVSEEISISQEIILKLKAEYQQQDDKKQQLLREIQAKQKQLKELLRFYENIQTDIEHLERQKGDKNKQNESTIYQIKQIKEDSEIRHARDNLKMEMSKESIKEIQKDLVRVETELKYVESQNQRLGIIKVEIQKSTH